MMRQTKFTVLQFIELFTPLKSKLHQISIAKGPLIPNCLLGIIVWSKIPTKFFPGFLPKPLKIMLNKP